MREVWCLLLSLSWAFASPYYYRESKHEAQHHKEYSYGGHETPGQLPEAFHEDAVLVPGLSATSKPERYSMYTAVPQVSSSYSQGHEGSYSYSHGGMQGGSLYQSSAPTYSVSRHEVIQPATPVVVTRRVVRVYGYPTTSSQSGYFQVSKTGQGDEQYSGGHTRGSYFQGGQREVSLESTSGEQSLYAKHEAESGQREVSEEFGQKEVSEEYGQKPYKDDTFSQEEISVLHSKPTVKPYVIPSVSGQRVERRYESQHSSKVEYGQQPAQVTGFKYIQTYGGSLYPNQGQAIKPISSGLILGQKEEPLDFPIQPGSPGSLYPSHVLEVGQKEESISGQEPVELGQKEESFVWQKEEKERTHQSKYSSLEVGQKEVPVQGFQTVRHHGSLYQSGNHLEIGQKEEALSGQEPEDLGQKEEDIGQTEEKESLFHGKYNSLEVGQKEEPVGFLVPKKPLTQGSLYQSQESHHLEVGQKEEPLSPYGQEPIDLGQKEEDLGQIEEKETLHHGRYSSLEVGQKEEPISGIQREHHTSHYEKHESHRVEVGQKEEPVGFLVPKKTLTQGSLYQSQESHNLEVGQKEESLSPYGQELDDLGQKEELLIGQREEDLGQEEVKESYQPGKYGSLEVGQKEEPFESSAFTLKNEKFERVHKNEKEVLITKPSQPWRREESQHEIEIGQKEEDLDEVGQKEEKETALYPQIPRGDLVLGQKQETDSFPAFGSHNYKEEVHTSWQQSKPCSHGEHSGYGRGQFGHDQETLHSTQKEVRVVAGDEPKPAGFVMSAIPALVRGDSGYSTVVRESSHSRQEIQKSNPGVQVTKITGEITRKPFGGSMDLDKMVEELASKLEKEGFTVKPNPIFVENSQTSKSLLTSTTPVSGVVHNAEIQELGTENFNTQTNIQSRVIPGVPQRRVNVFETHKEEYGYGPSSQRTYTKKHSRHYSMKEESHSVGSPQNLDESAKLLAQARSAQQSAGGWYGFSQQSSSGGQGDVLLHRVQRDRHSDIDSFLSELDKDIARDSKKPNQGGGYVQVSPQQSPSYSSGLSPSYSGQSPSYPRQSPSYTGTSPSSSGLYPSLSGQSPSYTGQSPSYPVQSPSYTGQSPAYSGGQYPSYTGQSPAYSGGQYPSYPVQSPSYTGQSPTLYGQTSHNTGTTSVSTSSSSTPWYKRIGENISSTYNKAKDKIGESLGQAKEKIGESFGQAKEKAKEMVSNVKSSF